MPYYLSSYHEPHTLAFRPAFFAEFPRTEQTSKNYRIKTCTYARRSGTLCGRLPHAIKFPCKQQACLFRRLIHSLHLLYLSLLPKHYVAAPTKTGRSITSRSTISVKQVTTVRVFGLIISYWATRFDRKTLLGARSFDLPSRTVPRLQLLF